MGLLVWLVVGLIAGALARLLVPGRDPLGCLGTLGVGLLGSLLGGFLGNLVTNDELRISTSGIVGSTIGAIIVLLILRATVWNRDRAA